LYLADTDFAGPRVLRISRCDVDIGGCPLLASANFTLVDYQGNRCLARRVTTGARDEM